MPIIRVHSYAERYGIRAQQIQRGELPLSRLSGRLQTRTIEERSAEIIQHLALEQTDVVADIGCGDGHLLNVIAPMIRYGVGVVPTQAEYEVLRSAFHLPNVQFECGRIESLPLPTERFDKIVCNGVLLHLDSMSTVQRAFEELSRIAKPGARLFIGEVPEVDEFEAETALSKSPVAWLKWTWKHAGKRAFVTNVVTLVQSMFTSKIIVVVDQAHFFAPPPVLMDLAKASGLHIQNYFRSRLFFQETGLTESKTRYDYVLLKP